jgi:hypothetical protein
MSSHFESITTLNVIMRTRSFFFSLNYIITWLYHDSHDVKYTCVYMYVMILLVTMWICGWMIKDLVDCFGGKSLIPSWNILELWFTSLKLTWQACIFFSFLWNRNLHIYGWIKVTSLAIVWWKMFLFSLFR